MMSAPGVLLFCGRVWIGSSALIPPVRPNALRCMPDLWRNERLPSYLAAECAADGFASGKV